MEDAGSSASSGVPSQSIKAVKWNFPPAGDIFRNVIRNFINQSDDKSLVALCKKLPTFASCWLECFFKHLQDCNKIEVFYTNTDSSSGINEVKLKYCQVKVGGSNMKKGILYETKAYFPITDAIFLCNGVLTMLYCRMEIETIVFTLYIVYSRDNFTDDCIVYSRMYVM